MAKSSPSVEVIQDSEEEVPKSKKEVDKSKNQKDNKRDADSKSNDDGGPDDEEEYEIEAILDAKHGFFPGGRMGYFVKWKGYSDTHNSWVDQEDAGNAQLLIEDYWRRKKKETKGKSKTPKSRPRKSEAAEESPDVDEQPSKKRKKSSTAGRKSKSSPLDGDDDGEGEDDEDEKPQPKKNKKDSRGKDASPKKMDVDEDDELSYKPMQKYKERKSWENLVDHVDTIEKIEGTLKVFFTLNNGDKVVETSQECAKHFPLKLIQFYESNLRWRESE